jgi:hypothetical protein
VKFSENYNFFLPQRGDNDPADPNIFSSNFEIIDRILGNLHPVGDIVLRMDETNPATLYGGVWEKIQDAFLIGAGGKYNLGSSGGEEEVQLTVEQLPSHSHSFGYGIATDAPGVSPTVMSSQNYTVNTAPTGGDEPHNNIPPYVAVNIWQRIA